jgi:acyl carrier protein
VDTGKNVSTIEANVGMWDVKYNSNLFVYSYLPVIQVACGLQLLESSPLSVTCTSYLKFGARDYQSKLEGRTEMTSENHLKDQNAATQSADLPKVSALHPISGLPDVQGAPKNTLQEVLSKVWAESLGIEKVGIEDDFFELGGASVVATQIVSRLRQMFQMDLPAILLFDTPTIEKLAHYMIEHEAQPGLTEKTAILLKRIEGMTEEEVARSLGSK